MEVHKIVISGSFDGSKEILKIKRKNIRKEKKIKSIINMIIKKIKKNKKVKDGY